MVKSQFTTCTGKAVDLAIYAEAKNIDRCDFAMESLKRAMKWDEDRFGLEYDLDLCSTSSPWTISTWARWRTSL